MAAFDWAFSVRIEVYPALDRPHRRLGLERRGDPPTPVVRPHSGQALRDRLRHAIDENRLGQTDELVAVESHEERIGEELAAEAQGIEVVERHPLDRVLGRDVHLHIGVEAMKIAFPVDTIGCERGGGDDPNAFRGDPVNELLQFGCVACREVERRLPLSADLAESGTLEEPHRPRYRLLRPAQEVVLPYVPMAVASARSRSARP